MEEIPIKKILEKLLLGLMVVVFILLIACFLRLVWHTASVPNNYNLDTITFDELLLMFLKMVIGVGALGANLWLLHMAKDKIDDLSY